MNKPKNWEDPQDDIPYTKIVSFAISLSTASCGVGVEHLYAEDGFMRALYHFHIYYTARRILWRLKVLLPAAPNFDPWKTSVDSTVVEKFNQEFSVGPQDSWNYDPRRFVQDGINGDYYYINQFAGQIPELTDGLTAAGLKAISESIRAYKICVLSAKFVNALETYIKRPIGLSAEVARYQSLLYNASTQLCTCTGFISHTTRFGIENRFYP